MARNKTSRAWMQRHVTDVHVQQARREGYRSRAAYKLKELARADRLIRPGMVVVDLGAAPGGWSQVAVELVGTGGRVIAVDLLEMTPLAGVEFVRGDFADTATVCRIEALLGARKAALVISDMAPNISGIASIDQARTMHLGELALDFALARLQPGGDLLVKTFQGLAFDEFRRRVGRHFQRVLTRKPAASRSDSSEVYLLARSLTDSNAGSSASNRG